MPNEEVTAAGRRISGQVRRTPLLRTEFAGRPVVFKLEQLQRTGSFKLRGALNALLSGELPDAVVTASGGNHGIGVATAARILGLPATVYVPESVPDGKAKRIEAAGARLVRAGDRYADAAAMARSAATTPGVRYLEAYDDPAVIAGQGTVAAEIVLDAPEVDALVASVGGGGLAAGTALAADGRKVVAVEPEGCRCLHDALAAGEPVDSPVDSVASSALGASRIGRVPFEVLTDHHVHSVLVTDDQIIAAQNLLWDEFRLTVEPAAALPFAAFVADLIPATNPALILCGANT
ncbi:serine/threonine dehydratase [Amycolatopsis nigrescens]|uniref:serine/threonine dehydratase n=1 Tax=Amycolatopsis nigrescens TaxID=381445 RepID=UPI000364EA1C|nr:serine/threonine dehydratase [Amycolatopsis nigrescens]